MLGKYQRSNILEWEEKDTGLEEEIMAENFLNLVKDVNVQIQNTQQLPKRLNSKKTMYRHNKYK